MMNLWRGDIRIMPEDRRRFQLRSKRPGEETLEDEQKVRVGELFDRYLKKTGQKKDEKNDMDI